MLDDRSFQIILWLGGLQVAFNAWVAVALIKLNVSLATLLVCIPKRFTDGMDKPEKI